MCGDDPDGEARNWREKNQRVDATTGECVDVETAECPPE